MKWNLKDHKDVMLTFKNQNALSDHNQLREFTMSLKWILFVTLSIGLLWTYFLIAFFDIDKKLIAAIVASFGGIFCFVELVYKYQLVLVTRLKGLAFASIIVLLTIIALDIAYRVYFGNISMSREKIINYYRLTDQHIYIGERIPRRYHATEKRFFIHKPNVTMSSIAYGGLYYKMLMECPTIVNNVLELKHISSSIDKHGFRETTPLEQARIFTLGDSFTYGVGVSQDETWVELLEKAIEEPIYNLGVSGHSLKQELMLLEYILQSKSDVNKISHLLWMIFEGNDLESSYETFISHQIQQKYNVWNSFRDIIGVPLHSVLSAVKEQSVVNMLMAGRITLASPFKDTDRTDPYVVDGIRLAYPLYQSTQYGYRLFYPEYIERARKSKAYVMKHPNRKLLDQVFKDMVFLSKKYGFKVTILIAPSAPRLYAPYFENISPISEEPYFINYVKQLSNRMDLDVINLYQFMQPYAEGTLLYSRDDTHWNKRGHEVVAEIIAKRFVHVQPGLSNSWWPSK